VTSFPKTKTKTKTIEQDGKIKEAETCALHDAPFFNKMISG